MKLFLNLVGPMSVTHLERCVFFQYAKLKFWIVCLEIRALNNCIEHRKRQLIAFFTGDIVSSSINSILYNLYRLSKRLADCFVGGLTSQLLFPLGWDKGYVSYCSVPLQPRKHKGYVSHCSVPLQPRRHKVKEYTNGM